MNAIEKFEHIWDWFAVVSGEKAHTLRAQEDYGRIEEIHTLVGEVLPPDILELFAKYDGEGPDTGSFRPHGLTNLDSLIVNLRFAESLIKSAEPFVTDPDRSREIEQAIVNIYLDHVQTSAPVAAAGGTWNRLEFSCSPCSVGGPYLYSSVATGKRDSTILSLSHDRMTEVWALAGKLHALEREHYNWDELEFTLQSDGTYRVERAFYDFGEFTSFPAGAIRTKYFHIKWVPVIEDYGGNFIGVDLDPGPQGKKGQVIVFGRDVQDMGVLADSWEAFLDLLIARIENGGEEFKGEESMFDFLNPAR